ncbi:MAG TPA: hypothetical protein VII00_08920 [bacterium]
MKNLKKIFYAIFMVILLASACKKDAKKMYIFLPDATFHKGAPEIRFPPCSNPDYPLYCAKDNKCCPTDYPYHCASNNTCYPSTPSCSGYDTCSPDSLVITSVESSKSSITSGEKVTFTVHFKIYSSITVTTIIVYFVELNVYFEETVTLSESQSGGTEFDMGLSDTQPSLSTCTRQCASTGECEPCYTEIPEGMTDVLVSLEDNGGKITSSPPVKITIGEGGGGGGGGQYCYSTSACIPSVLSDSCECGGSTTESQCPSGYPPCSSPGEPCGDGTHACCVGDTCINGTCVSGCGECTGKGCQ